MDLATALEFAADHRRGILTTIRRNGRPQQSNVLYHSYEGGLIRISITATRAKYHNLRREPWAALHVSRDDFFAYVVLEGEAELAPVSNEPDDPTVDELVDYYRDAVGEHPDWDEYRRAMVDEQRTIVRFRPDRAYGMLNLPEPA